MFVSNVPQPADIILRDHVGHDSAQVPEELIRGLGAVHHAAGQDRQQGDGIVPIASGKLFGESIGPVLRAHLITVDRNPPEGGSFRRRDLVEQLTEHGVEMMLDVCLAHFVALQPGPLRGSGGVLLAGGDHSKTDDGPFALGERAGQHSLGIEFVGQVDEALLLDDRGGIVGFDRVREDVGFPGRAGVRVHPAHLLLDDLGDGRGRSQFDAATGIGLEHELPCGDVGEAERLDAVRQEVGYRAAAGGMNVGNELSLALLQCVKFGFGFAVNDQPARREGLCVGKTKHAAGFCRLGEAPGSHPHGPQRASGKPPLWLTGCGHPGLVGDECLHLVCLVLQFHGGDHSGGADRGIRHLDVNRVGAGLDVFPDRCGFQGLPVVVLQHLTAIDRKDIAVVRGEKYTGRAQVGGVCLEHAPEVASGGGRAHGTVLGRMPDPRGPRQGQRFVRAGRAGQLGRTGDRYRLEAGQRQHRDVLPGGHPGGTDLL